MKRTVLIFGLISGMISSVLMAATMPFVDKLGEATGLILGYTTIVLSFLLVYFGIRSYRDNVGGGRISFGKAFSVGILITLISCVFYVAAWEVLSYKFMPDFAEKYAAQDVARLKASGASADAVQKETEKMEEFKVQYAKPWYNIAMTFIEPFPVGLVITLISAAVLRRKDPVESGLPVAG